MKKKVKVNINVGYGETNYDKDDNVLTIFCKSILDVSKELESSPRSSNSFLILSLLYILF